MTWSEAEGSYSGLKKSSKTPRILLIPLTVESVTTESKESKKEGVEDLAGRDEVLLVVGVVDERLGTVDVEGILLLLVLETSLLDSCNSISAEDHLKEERNKQK